MTIYTIRTGLTGQSYGFTTTQAYRHQLLEQRGISHRLVVSSPLSFPYKKRLLQQVGLDAKWVTIVPEMYSDLSSNAQSFHRTQFEAWLEQVDGAVSTLIDNDTQLTYRTPKGYYDVDVQVNGILTSLLFRHIDLSFGYRATCTNGVFFRDFENGTFDYLNADGTIAITCYRVEGNYEFEINGKRLTDNELLFDYLKKIMTTDDVIINDQLQSDHHQLRIYCREHDIAFRDVLHYSHFHAIKQATNYRTILPKDVFVAVKKQTEWLQNEGLNARYFPPVGVSISPQLPRGLNSNRVCLMGNFRAVKRIDMAINAFRKVPELELHIYGGRAEEIEQLKKSGNLPENVVLKGFVQNNRIPRQDYFAYLSCSETEVYANALVECMGVGLIPILSDVDFQHRTVLHDLHLETGFETVDELIVILKKFAYHIVKNRDGIAKSVQQYAKQYFSHTVV